MQFVQHFFVYRQQINWGYKDSIQELRKFKYYIHRLFLFISIYCMKTNLLIFAKLSKTERDKCISYLCEKFGDSSKYICIFLFFWQLSNDYRSTALKSRSALRATLSFLRTLYRGVDRFSNPGGKQ